jgi:hypothetical protein
MYDHKKLSDPDEFTLRHYNKAMSGLVHDQGFTNESANGLVTILTCCFLFALLESLRGNFSRAIRHIKSGTGLIANHKPSTCLPNQDIANLAAMFHAISGQIGLFSNNRICVDIAQFMIPKKRYSRPARKLRDLVEAEDILNTFDDVISHILWDLDHDWEDNNSECRKQWVVLRKRLRVWDHQFTAVVKDLVGSSQSPTDMEKIINLRIQYKLWELLLNGENLGVGYNNQHTAQLDTADCTLLLDDLECLWSKSKRPFYGLKTDLTTALFQLHVFCDDETVRRRIICMLRARKRREILWDSLQLADFLETDMARRASGLQTARWPDIGPSSHDSALIVFKI